MYYYKIMYGEYDEWNEIIFISETKYSEKEFNKLIQEAIQALYEVEYKEENRARCYISPEPSDCFYGSRNDNPFKKYIINNSDLEILENKFDGILIDISRQIFDPDKRKMINNPNWPKFDKTKLSDCRKKCRYQGKDVKFKTCWFDGEDFENRFYGDE